jgi:hypothetical protein
MADQGGGHGNTIDRPPDTRWIVLPPAMSSPLISPGDIATPLFGARTMPLMTDSLLRPPDVEIALPDASILKMTSVTPIPPVNKIFPEFKIKLPVSSIGKLRGPGGHCDGQCPAAGRNPSGRVARHFRQYGRRCRNVRRRAAARSVEPQFPADSRSARHLSWPSGRAWPTTFRHLATHGEYGEVDVEAEVRRLIEAAGRQYSTERTRPDGRAIEVRANPVPGGGSSSSAAGRHHLQRHHREETRRGRDPRRARHCREGVASTAFGPLANDHFLKREGRQPWP